ncbi:hypothetical protein SteCoe_11198 [Stentor coeruleus]|uniref:Uncharacterized protein n=1 Tax=Stentor coeruleus TaxID=5963 RepID=A0A1R2CDS5_9CILI|nr:hypothetical protein SteCoe_11198 [Stentor coeruleus]
MNLTAKLPLIRRSNDSRGSLRSTLGPISLSMFSPKEKKEYPIKFLRPSREGRGGSMETYKGPIGLDAKLDFVDTFKHLPMFTERNRIQNLEDTPNIAYLGEVSRRNLKPEPFGIVRRNGPETSIDIQGYGMGDTYAEAFSEGLSVVKDVETLNLKENRLTDSGASKILNKLIARNLKKVILSENRIGLKSILCLEKILNHVDSKIKVLELEKTHLSDKALESLCRLLIDNKILVRLSLAKNNIGEGCAKPLKELIISNNTLKYLDLHWNQLGKEGAIDFFEGLGQNKSLKHLDLSWNSLGRSNNFATAKALGQALNSQKFLQHVDLSHNYFNQKECEIIGDGLLENHRIYGIHMAGNDCHVDSKGYIIPVEYQNKTDQGHLHTRLLSISRFKEHNISRLNCWICEKWVEVYFDWKPEISGQECNGPIFIHLDCDNYKPSVTQEKNGIFSIKRMVPHGHIKFFFSADSKFMRSKEYKTKILDTPIRLEFPTPDKKKFHINISKVNVIYIESEDWDPQGPEVKPRNDPKVREWTETIIEKIPWDFNTSTFKDYRFDTEEVLSKCINFDFDVSNIKDIITDGNERQEIQDSLASHYKLITEAFKQLSATSGIELFNIGKNTLNEFLKKCNLFSTDFTMNDVAILWNLSNAPQVKGEAFNAGNGLCRYEFAEFMVRLAIDKFYKNKKVKTIKEALERLMNEYLVPGMKLFDQSSWKTDFYLIEDVDHVLKAFKPILEPVFIKYAASGKGPLDKINLHEFRMFCNDAGLNSDTFAMREIDMCFRQAMMTEIDEILDGDHLEMVYVEFVEGLARVADLLYMNPKDPELLAFKLLKIMPSVAKVCPDHITKFFEWPSDETLFNLKYKKRYVAKYEYVHSSN